MKIILDDQQITFRTLQTILHNKCEDEVIELVDMDEDSIYLEQTIYPGK